MSRLSRWQDLMLPISLIIASVLVILVPLPPTCWTCCWR